MRKKEVNKILVSVIKDALGFYIDGCNKLLPCDIINTEGPFKMAKAYEFDEDCDNNVLLSPGDIIPDGMVTDVPFSIVYKYKDRSTGKYYFTELEPAALLEYCKCCSEKSTAVPYYYGDDGGIGGGNLEEYERSMTFDQLGIPEEEQSMEYSVYDLSANEEIFAATLGLGGNYSDQLTALVISHSYFVAIKVINAGPEGHAQSFKFLENGVDKSGEWTYNGGTGKWQKSFFSGGGQLPAITLQFVNIDTLILELNTDAEDKIELYHTLAENVLDIDWGGLGTEEFANIYAYTTPGTYTVTIKKIRSTGYNLLFDGTETDIVSIPKFYDTLQGVSIINYNDAGFSLTPLQVEEILLLLDSNTPTGLTTISISKFNTVDLTVPAAAAKLSLEGKGVIITLTP